MKSQMRFQRNAHVLDANAREIGKLNRVVVDTKTREVTHVVVRKGSLFKKEDKLIPIGMVAETVKDQVLLSPDAGDAERLPLFEETQFVSESRGSEAPAVQPTIMPGGGAGSVAVVSDPVKPVVTETVQNIPRGTVAMKEGARVVTAEGQEVGKVEQVRAGPETDRMTDLLVSSGGMFTREEALIPADLVKSIDEDEVRLHVNKASLENERPLHPSTGSE